MWRTSSQPTQTWAPTPSCPHCLTVLLPQIWGSRLSGRAWQVLWVISPEDIGVLGPPRAKAAWARSKEAGASTACFPPRWGLASRGLSWVWGGTNRQVCGACWAWGADQSSCPFVMQNQLGNDPSSSPSRLTAPHPTFRTDLWALKDASPP